MDHGTDVNVLRNDRDERRRLFRISKVMAVTAVIASSAMAGMHAPAVDDAAVSLTTEVRTLKGIIPWSISKELSNSVCGTKTSNTCTDLDYPTLSGDAGVARGAVLLRDTLRTTSSPKVIFAYSEGAVVATQWLTQHAKDTDAPSAKNLSFILIGNPKRKYGGSPGSYINTPNTPSTQYSVLDVAREYDGVADLPDDPWNFLAVANAFAGYFLVHTGYTSVDLVNDAKLVWKEGNTTYVLVHTPDLPLMAGLVTGLRIIGLGAWADAIQEPWRKLIDAGYNRNYPGIITDPVKAQKAVDDALRGPSVTKSQSADAAPTTDTAKAAAATATALFASQRIEKTFAIEDAPAVTTEAKTVAAEDVKADQSDDADAPEPQAEPSETSETSDTENVGRHRAPEVTDDTTSTPAESPSTPDPGPQQAKPAQANDSPADSTSDSATA